MTEQPLFDRIDTIILRVRNYEAAADRYAERLGLQATYTDPVEGLVVVAFDGHSLTLWQLKPGEELPPRGTCVPFPIFVTADVAALHAELQAGGVAVEAVQRGGGGASSPSGTWMGTGSKRAKCRAAATSPVASSPRMPPTNASVPRAPHGRARRYR